MRRSNGEIAGHVIVDDEDYDKFSSYRWSLASNGRAVRTVIKSNRSFSVYLHREVANVTDGAQWVRFANKNTLDCRKSNLIIRAPSRKMGRAEGYRIYRLRSKYGLEEKEYKAMLAEQDGKCKICASDMGKSHDVDHCHVTGVVRGLLCRKCNLGIHRFDDDREWLKLALKYLDSYPKDGKTNDRN